MRGMIRAATVALAAMLTSAACATDPGGPVDGVDARFVAEVATYQQVAGEPSRFTVGLIAAGGRWVSFGSATLSFSGDDGTTSTDLDGITAEFLPLPGSPEPEPGADVPTLTLASEGRGVYAVESITLPDPGFWIVEVTVELDGETATAEAAFEVLEAPIVPAVGDPAPATDHPVTGDGGDPGVLDSRARDGELLPDPELHELSIADALAAGRPALVLFSTPVYCTSRFCGPITDMVAELAAEHATKASFVHVEVWSDFEAERLNPAAEAWIATDDDRVLEPWLFLVDADGTVIGSWDNIATRAEVEAALEALP